MSMDTLHKPELVTEGSEEFEARCAEALRRVASKYAWTAQHQGVVLRRNPLKQPPYKDYVYNRIAKAEYGFHFLDERRKKRSGIPTSRRCSG
jgi:hypothetical protein